MYTCAICGKTYDSYEDYARCVAECARKRHEEDEKAKREKLIAEKQHRLEHIRELQKRCAAEIDSFEHDYGYRPYEHEDFHNSFFNRLNDIFF